MPGKENSSWVFLDFDRTDTGVAEQAVCLPVERGRAQERDPIAQKRGLGPGKGLVRKR